MGRPPKTISATKESLTINGEMSNFSASPPQTPAINLLSRERWNFLNAHQPFISRDYALTTNCESRRGWIKTGHRPVGRLAYHAHILTTRGELYRSRRMRRRPEAASTPVGQRSPPRRVGEGWTPSGLEEEEEARGSN